MLVGLLSLPMANAESMADAAPPSRSAADIFANAARDESAILDETKWSDFPALGYARSERSDAAGVRRLTQPMPAVDGINGKIAAFGGGANHTNGFYGAARSLAVPLGQQWGVQIDGAVGSFVNSGLARGVGAAQVGAGQVGTA